MRLLLSVFIMVLLSLTGSRAQVIPPSGIYCSCPPTLSESGGSVVSAVAEKAFVKGILVRVGWATLEPQRNQFNWAPLDSQFVRAKAYGKRIALGIVNGGGAPSWLYQHGAEPFPFLFRGVPDTLPVPWDTTYLAEWTEFVAALGSRYGNDSTLALVHITHSTGNGFEMQLPSTPPDVANWQAIGYSHRRVIDSWKRVADTFRDAFPTAPLDVDLHPVLQSDSVSREVLAYGLSSIGRRFGAFAAWWSQHNTTVYPAQYALLLNAVDSSFAAVQMVGNGTQDSARFGEGGLPTALERAESDGIRYWEVWNQDLLNPQFEPLFRRLAGLPTAVQETQTPFPHYELHQNFPNPFNPTTTIRFEMGSPGMVTLKVYDMLGRFVASLVNGQRSAGMHEAVFDASGLASGIYFYRLSTGRLTVVRKMVVLE